MFDFYIPQILKSKVYDVAIETPMTRACFVSRRIENNVFIKREDMQEVFSFKIRGAYNKIAQLSNEERARGVVTASAGNHAQGVALSARRLGISAKIVMPLSTPGIKVNNVRERGGEVVLFGDSFEQSVQEAHRIKKEENRVFIHPYDDPLVIAGQGTIAMEMIRQISEPIDAVFVPVGGGGLIAGVATYIKYLRPETKVIAVESEQSACLEVAMRDRARTKLPRVGLFADGVAVAQIGEETFKLCQKYVDEIITCSNDEICVAIKEIFEETRTVSEPSGALSLAGLKKYVEKNRVKNQNLVCILSGANLDFGKLRYISERAGVGSQREALFSVNIPEEPNSFLTFIKVVSGHNVTQFSYRYHDADAQNADVLIGVNLSSPEERYDIMQKYNAAGYTVLDLTDDDLSKGHVSYMVGGHLPSNAGTERVFDIQFPERPGALEYFLSCLNGRWSMSLFHYRYQGGIVGEALTGFLVPDAEMDAFMEFLDSTHYEYVEASDTPGYLKFLKN